MLCFVALFVHRKLDTPFFLPFNSFLFCFHFSRLKLQGTGVVAKGFLVATPQVVVSSVEGGEIQKGRESEEGM